MNHIEARAIDWAAWVRAGDRVVCSHMTAEPVALLRSLATANPHVGQFHVFLGVPFSDVSAAFAVDTTFTTFGGMGSAGALARSHAVQVSMAHYSQCGLAFASGDERADVLLVSLARAPDGTLVLVEAVQHAASRGVKVLEQRHHVLERVALVNHHR